MMPRATENKIADGLWQDLESTIYAVAADSILIQQRRALAARQSREEFSALLAAVPADLRSLVLPLDAGRADKKPGRCMEILRYLLAGDRVGGAFQSLMRYFSAVNTVVAPLELPTTLPWPIEKLAEAFGQLLSEESSLKEIALELELARPAFKQLFALYRQGGRCALGIK